MKKFGLLLAGGVAAIILLGSVGPMIGLVISAAILYFIYKKFIKTESTGWKIALIIIGLMVLSAAIPNIPALIGVGAAYILYLVYKEWNKSKTAATKGKGSNDPFVNFENQWNELKK